MLIRNLLNVATETSAIPQLKCILFDQSLLAELTEKNALLKYGATFPPSWNVIWELIFHKTPFL